MTIPRRDGQDTPFSDWLRTQDKIKSNLGYSVTDIDYFWHDFNKGLFLFIEVKCHIGTLSWSQQKLYGLLHEALKNTDGFRGVHLVELEKERPDDGGSIYLNGKEITKDELLMFLKFDHPDSGSKPEINLKGPATFTNLSPYILQTAALTRSN